MASTQALYQFFCSSIAPAQKTILSQKEILILEANLFSKTCDSLKEIHRERYKNYFRVLKLNNEKENSMLDGNFMQCILKDILSTEEYTLSGIAYYTNTCEEVIYEIALGKNVNPSLFLARKIMDIHKSVRPELYKEILKKALLEEMN